MANYHYKARSSSGELLEGTMEAASVDAVAGQLLANGISPLKISAVQAGSDVLGTLRNVWRARQKAEVEDLILFCRQMHTLTRAGIPLVRAFKGLEATAHKPVLARTLRAVVEDIESGRDLSAALARHPRVFPSLLVSMIQVGENSGQLDEAFQQVARYLEQDKDTRDRVKEALRYPAFVTAAIAVALAVINLLVVPAFARVFRSFGADLPLPTRILLAISKFTTTYWPLLLVGTLVGGWLLLRYLKTDSGRLLWGRYKLKLPLVGDIILRATMVRFARAFSMGYSAGVPLVQALGLTARAVDNPHVGGRIDKMRNNIERGETLTNAAGNTRLFTPLVLQMLAVGEETGAVDSTLLEVADFYEREIEYDLKKLSSAIEPILVVAMGGMVLILALGVFLPMWNLTAIAR
ncbi:MSHA biogenesis protein MshG [Desulfuromonas versatilis]|uniref:MSHA biogenesis protein MshG n=1 Tax=Desulfuromonas versatilis TaxID=2802975 RepID=A0ABN6E684_9BACT|nr:type II secretion system F family protein [Desulfuromonas versatilis]BCR06401.1 MSHA biogenesis protein MshG [Desulfuromonas versatilis]